MSPSTPPPAGEPATPGTAEDANLFIPGATAEDQSEIHAPLPLRFFARAKALSSGRLADWSLLLGKFVGIQLIVQVITFGSGLLLVRRLSKEDYAFFTIANTMMGTMNMLADSGIGSGLTSIGGRVWDQPARLGQLIRTALQLRRTFGIVTFVCVTPVLTWLLMRNGASLPLTGVVVVIVLFSLFLQLNIGVLSVIPRLLLQTGRLQQMDLLSACLRLLLLLIAAYALLNVSVALFVATVTFTFQWLLLRHWVAGCVPAQATPDPEMRGEILKIVRRQGPNSLYYCLQGQIGVWLISVFGNTRSVADLGALGRLAVIFTVVGSVMNSIVIPRFARIQEAPLLWRRYWHIAAAYTLLISALIGAAARFPDLFLSVLGGKYSHLHRELPLLVATSGLGAIVGSVWSLNASRGWIVPTWLNVGMSVTTQIVCLRLVDLSSVRGVLLLGSASLLPELVITVLFGVHHMRLFASIPPNGAGPLQENN